MGFPHTEVPLKPQAPEYSGSRQGQGIRKTKSRSKNRQETMKIYVLAGMTSCTAVPSLLVPTLAGLHTERSIPSHHTAVQAGAHSQPCGRMGSEQELNTERCGPSRSHPANGEGRSSQQHTKKGGGRAQSSDKGRRGLPHPIQH